MFMHKVAHKIEEPLKLQILTLKIPRQQNHVHESNLIQNSQLSETVYISKNESDEKQIQQMHFHI